MLLALFMPETRDTICESEWDFSTNPQCLIALCHIAVLSKKSARIRKATGRDDIYADHEQDKKKPGHLWKVSLTRPFIFLFTEPITYLSAGING